MQVADAGTDQEVQVHRVARNFIAHHRKVQRLGIALAQDGDVHRRALGPFEQIGHVACRHVVGRLAVNGRNDVAWADAGPVRGRSGKWRNHDDLIVARHHLHAHAVVTAALLFLQSRILLRVEEVRVRVEHPQHARNGTVVDRLVGIQLFRVILLQHAVDLGEAAHRIAQVIIAHSLHGPGASEDHSEKAAGQDYQKYYNERSTGTSGHEYSLLLLALERYVDVNNAVR